MTKTRTKSLAKQKNIVLPKGRGLNMSHRQHSGRLLPHAHTSYPVLAMLLLFVGVLLVNAGQTASAATGSYQVTAAYLGPPPATAATIDTPTDGVHVRSVPLTVSGSCPADTYVTLTRNGVSSGSAICGPLNTYSLQTDLFAGANALVTQVFSKFNVAGPDSKTVTVIYDGPLVATPNITSPTGSAQANASQPSPALPLLLKSNFQYHGHDLGQSVSYQFEIVGGTAPYAVNINWGDGTTKTLSLAASGPFSVSHVYEKSRQYQASYKIAATAGDADGSQTLLQLLAIINDRPTTPLAKTNGNSGQTGIGFGQQIHNALKYIWPTYGLAVIMILSFWLGELRELRILRTRSGQSHHA